MEKRVLGRRDAGVFVRAVRHYGLQVSRRSTSATPCLHAPSTAASAIAHTRAGVSLQMEHSEQRPTQGVHAAQSKLEAICKEVGRVVEKAPAGARLGLWFGLLRGCDRAMADAPSLGKEAKVLCRATSHTRFCKRHHVPCVHSRPVHDCECSCYVVSLRDGQSILVQDALLDFYGVPVKAAEVRSHIDRMRLLADKVWHPNALPLSPGPAVGLRCSIKTCCAQPEGGHGS
jgi:hypothetical protein